MLKSILTGWQQRQKEQEQQQSRNTIELQFQKIDFNCSSYYTSTYEPSWCVSSVGSRRILSSSCLSNFSRNLLLPPTNSSLLELLLSYSFFNSSSKKCSYLVQLLFHLNLRARAILLEGGIDPTSFNYIAATDVGIMCTIRACDDRVGLLACYALPYIV